MGKGEEGREEQRRRERMEKEANLGEINNFLFDINKLRHSVGGFEGLIYIFLQFLHFLDELLHFGEVLIRLGG